MVSLHGPWMPYKSGCEKYPVALTCPYTANKNNLLGAPMNKSRSNNQMEVSNKALFPFLWPIEALRMTKCVDNKAIEQPVNQHGACRLKAIVCFCYAA